MRVPEAPLIDENQDSKMTKKSGFATVCDVAQAQYKIMKRTRVVPGEGSFESDLVIGVYSPGGRVKKIRFDAGHLIEGLNNTDLYLPCKLVGEINSSLEEEAQDNKTAQETRKILTCIRFKKFEPAIMQAIEREIGMDAEQKEEARQVLATAP